MNSKVALVLLGLAAISSASYVRGRPGLVPSRGGYVSATTEAPEESEYVHEKAAAPEVSYTKVAEDYSYVAAPVKKLAVSSAVSREENERVALEQAKSAKYAFASAVNDGIQDQSQVRQETRDGLKVSGSYSYTDGFFKRTVRYEADENGYRVVNEETEPIGSGPEVDLVNGKADVHTQVEGVDTQYSISAHDIKSKEEKVKESS